MAHKNARKRVSAPEPLGLEEISLYQKLPVLTLEQIARVLQKTTAQVHEMSRARATRPLPVFRSGKTLCSTWQKIQQWVEEGFADHRAAA
jgi:hypothetical protein